MFNNKKRRYPGTKPFTRDEASLFYGREMDIKKLDELVSLEPLVVVYGKSGYGKSSLINAGLLPLLEQKESNVCLMPRLNAWIDESSPSPLSKIRETLKVLPKDYEILDKILPDDDTLWRKIKASQIANPGQRFNIFFDQFEELFTYPKESIHQFKTQLAEILRNQIPRRYEKALDSAGSENNEVLTLKEEDILYNSLNIRLVLIIRSDKMHLLDQLSDYLPKILRNNYEIKALTEPSAITALVEPAKLKEATFYSPPFTYSQAALTNITNFLKDDSSGLIEAIQLQILASSFEDKVVSDNLSQLTPSNIGDLKSIVKNYYNNRLKSISDPDERKLASKMIEDGLVDKTRHQRLTLHESQIRDLFGVESELLEKLVNVHLLRRQPDIRSGYNYELSHDTLIEPVIDARNVREKEEAEEAYAHQSSELIRERKKRRRATIIAAAAVLASLVAGYFGYVSYKQGAALKKQESDLIIKEEQLKSGNKQLKLQSELVIISQKEARKEKENADSLFNVAKAADKKSQIALIDASRALQVADLAKQEAVTANLNFASEIKKGKDFEAIISGDDPYAVIFLEEEGDRSLANENFQNALTYFAAAKFALEKDKDKDSLTYRILGEKIDMTAKMAKAEKFFRFGDSEGAMATIGAFPESKAFKGELNPLEIYFENRMNQLYLSEEVWESSIREAKYKLGNTGEIYSMDIGNPFRPVKFIVLPALNNSTETRNLKKLSISTSSQELYLMSMPESLDSLEIISSPISKIPPTNYENNLLSYLKIHDCNNLNSIGIEINNYDGLETLIITECPNIENVILNPSGLTDLQHLELGDNINLIFLLNVLSEKENIPDLRSLSLSNINYDESSVLLGIRGYEEQGYDCQESEIGYTISKFKNLESLELENLCFNDLTSQNFKFNVFNNLKKLKISDLKGTRSIPDLSTLILLEELTLNNLPLENDVISMITGLTSLNKLVLSDLPNLKNWGDLSGLVNLEHLTLKNLPIAKDINAILANMPNLKFLELDNVNLEEEFPSNINRLNKLTTLKINNCGIKDFAIDRLVLSSLKNLEVLGSDEMDKKSLDSLRNISSLESLAIQSDDLEFLNSMGQIKRLKIVYKKQKERIFPDVFSGLINLQFLEIQDTYAEEFPQSLFTLSQLNTIWLQITNFRSLSPQFVHNENLKNIIIQQCRFIESLPENIGDFSALENIFYFGALSSLKSKSVESLDLDEDVLIKEMDAGNGDNKNRRSILEVIKHSNSEN